MTENGDYSYNDEDSDFKRKSESAGGGGGQEHLDDHHQNENHVHLNEKANDYIRDCLLEKHKLDKSFPIAERLLDGEIEAVQKTGRIPTREPKYVDIYREKPIKVSQKVLVPVREHPKFNFVGKLLGPKGNSLRRLQEETLCKMTVLGRNSMKDRAKEEELRASMDPKYAHLNDDLHVEVSTIAPPAEAHARIAYAMAELRKYLIPDTNDAIRQEQLRELMENPSAGDHGDNITKSSVPPYKRTTGGGGVVSNQSGGGAGVGGGSQRPSYGGGYRQQAPSSTHQSGPPSGSGSRSVMPPKQKVFSILEKARTAMDESYSHAPPPPPQSNRVPYDVPEYETTDYRRDYYPHSPNYPAESTTTTTTNSTQQLIHDTKLLLSPSSSSSSKSSWKMQNSYCNDLKNDDDYYHHHHHHYDHYQRYSPSSIPISSRSPSPSITTPSGCYDDHRSSSCSSYSPTPPPPSTPSQLSHPSTKYAGTGNYSYFSSTNKRSYRLNILSRRPSPYAKMIKVR